MLKKNSKQLCLNKFVYYIDMFTKIIKHILISFLEDIMNCNVIIIQSFFFIIQIIVDIILIDCDVYIIKRTR
jgi:hypothetical protein